VIPQSRGGRTGSKVRRADRRGDIRVEPECAIPLSVKGFTLFCRRDPDRGQRFSPPPRMSNACRAPPVPAILRRESNLPEERKKGRNAPFKETDFCSIFDSIRTCVSFDSQ
jgi:hypothetical protein